MVTFFGERAGENSCGLFSAFSRCLPKVNKVTVLFTLFVKNSLLKKLLDRTFILSVKCSRRIVTCDVLVSCPISFVPTVLCTSIVDEESRCGATRRPLSDGGFKIHNKNVVTIIISVTALTTTFIIRPLDLVLPRVPRGLGRALGVVARNPVLTSLVSISVFTPLFRR